MIEKIWEILVPHNKNNGKTFSYEHHQIWDKKVYELAGGLTIQRVSKGKWLNNTGNIQSEGMIPVKICCVEEVFDEILEFTLKHYDQDEVLGYLISNRVKILVKD